MDLLVHSEPKYNEKDSPQAVFVEARLLSREVWKHEEDQHEGHFHHLMPQSIRVVTCRLHYDQVINIPRDHRDYW